MPMAKDTRDRRLEKQRYRAANREAVRALGRASYWRHREEILARQKEERAVKPPSKRLRAARTAAESKRRAANPERWREAQRDYYLRHRSAILAKERAKTRANKKGAEAPLVSPA